MSAAEREIHRLNQRIAKLEKLVEQLTQPKSDARLILPDGYGSIYLTPGGGIAALTGSSTPWTPGVATCTKCEYYLDSSTVKIKSTSVTKPVYNMVKSAVGASKLIQTKLIQGKETVDVEDCS